MSDEQVDPGGESYLEIQMDRSTIVLAALGLIVLLAAAFLLGSWLGSRGSGSEAIETTEASAADESAPTIDEEHDGEAVTGESGFGGRPVSAAGAPPISSVPQPARSASAPGPAPGDVAEEEVAAPSAPRRATAPRGATAAAASTPKPRAPKPTATAAAAAPASGTWIVQVAAAKDAAEADVLATRLRKKGWDVRLVHEGGYVKVQVGPFDSKSAAQAAEQRLKREERVSTWLKRA